MADLVNPFIGFKSQDITNSHNPYKFNPFKILDIGKDETDPETIDQIIKDLDFELDPQGLGLISENDRNQRTDALNAQGFLERPLQRLVFEILIASTNNSENMEGSSHEPNHRD